MSSSRRPDTLAERLEGPRPSRSDAQAAARRTAEGLEATRHVLEELGGLLVVVVEVEAEKGPRRALRLPKMANWLNTSCLTHEPPIQLGVRHSRGAPKRGKHLGGGQAVVLAVALDALSHAGDDDGVVAIGDEGDVGPALGVPREPGVVVHLGGVHLAGVAGGGEESVELRAQGALKERRIGRR